MSGAERCDVSFASHGETCAAWFLEAEGDAFASHRGRPCVVMAHGVGGTRDAGLLPFAEAYAEAGINALLFDYRCFGDSSGEPRQLGIPSRHRADYVAAIAFARSQEGVDADRIVLWGTSWSGGHVVYAASEDPRIAAVISQTPDLDGLRTLDQIRRYAGVGQLARVSAHGVRDQLTRLRPGAAPHTIPIVAPPGQAAAISSEGSEAGYLEIAGPTWRNSICARAVTLEAQNRAITRIDRLECPILVLIGLRDSVAPPGQARTAARRAGARAELREYDIPHFDVYVGEGRERSLSDQLEFLGRHLSPAPSRAASRPI
ncbi:MAG: alpha/beta fold hydrolase [Solirubrobacterales bacterium]|nr:alpha/beta fold hydrolase [Solirubrobacterales bacterium]